MVENHITVSKTARYFTLGNNSDEVKNVWFVCHGYGQLANYFIKNFEFLNTPENFIIAPEGLSKFYLDGFNGKIGASWMTKEDRLIEIKDQITYLDKLYEFILSQFSGKKVTINVLGFSQGTATVCRWLVNGRSKVDHIILLAGSIPPDINFEAAKSIFNKTKKLNVVIGNKDKFISSTAIETNERLLKDHGINYLLNIYEGGHEIKKDVLEEIIKTF